jgi:aryl-alcohol dehydrogenase-like predicted oxidoreductase
VTEEAAAFSIMDEALGQGINFFDVYGGRQMRGFLDVIKAARRSSARRHGMPSSV